jgi:polysaccharide pyruvyl transferase WcaK-like protein
VLLLWYQEDDNFGDVLLAQTTREYLEAREIEVVDYEVGRPCVEIIDAANKCDFLLFAGGGIIERGIPNVIRHFEEDYSELEVKYGVIGFGMADYDYTDYYETISFWVNKAEFFYVRDQYTKLRLNEISNSNKVVFSSDNVFANNYIALIRERNAKKENRIGINIRSMPYKDITGEIDSFAIERLCKQCEIGECIPDSDVQDWGWFWEEFSHRRMKDYSSLDRKEKVVVTIDSINRCEFVIAMRFHVVLVAARLGVIPIPIIYSIKVKNLVDQLGIGELSVNYNELQEIPSKIEMARNNKDFYLELLETRVKALENKSSNMFRSVIEKMETKI